MKTEKEIRAEIERHQAWALALEWVLAASKHEDAHTNYSVNFTYSDYPGGPRRYMDNVGISLRVGTGIGELLPIINNVYPAFKDVQITQVKRK